MIAHSRYQVKEIFYTLQGEGRHTGRAAVFCRFSNCNLWSGLEGDRATAVCQFCDTDFVGHTWMSDGGAYLQCAALADQIEAAWPKGRSMRARPLVVFTGGEPLLQLDEALIEAMHLRGFEVHVETNGTIKAPKGIDWLTVSPKAGTRQRVKHADEVKLAFPQSGLSPADINAPSSTRLSLQPIDGERQAENTALAVEYCLAHPEWRLSVQTHKAVGLR